MKRIAYFDCSSGIAGDMILAALFDSGLPVKRLESKLKSGLKIYGWHFKAEQVERNGLPGTLLRIVEEKSISWHATVKEMFSLIENSRLSSNIKNKSKKILELLVKAESQVHKQKISHVHFHELNSLDTIIDIVGSVMGLEELGIEELYVSPLNIGTAAPATMKILEGIAVHGSQFITHSSKTIDNRLRTTNHHGQLSTINCQLSAVELVTPTGAAIVKALAKSFDSMPMMNIVKSGFGAGTLELEGQANLLRMFVGSKLDGKRDKVEGRRQFTVNSQQSAVNDFPSPIYRLPSYSSDHVLLLETNIDDMDPRIFPYVMGKILKSGGLDVWLTQIMMKKGRPGIILSCLVPENDKIVSRIVDMIFRETTTIGIRFNSWHRYKLNRKIITKKKQWGKIKEKVSSSAGIKKKQVEYDTALKIAANSHIPLKKILKKSS
ncbi:MAG: LarC family nickel insertion protein [Elusimicrobia bacterium]|nr:LarC family nickel insertion protein [Candidatus Obscuribacterium magneticum]